MFTPQIYALNIRLGMAQPGKLDQVSGHFECFSDAFTLSYPFAQIAGNVLSVKMGLVAMITLF